MDRREFLRQSAILSASALLKPQHFLNELTKNSIENTRIAADLSLTAFEPFGEGKEVNASTELVKKCQMRRRDSSYSTHYITNLPVDNKNPRRAAESIKQNVYATMPRGGILIMTGEYAGLSAEEIRIEDVSRSRSIDRKDARLPALAPARFFYDLVVSSFEEASRTINSTDEQFIVLHSKDRRFKTINTSKDEKLIPDPSQEEPSSSPYFWAEKRKNRNTAGGYICEITYTLMLEEALAWYKETGNSLFCAFIHVPASQQFQEQLALWFDLSLSSMQQAMQGRRDCPTIIMDDDF